MLKKLFLVFSLLLSLSFCQAQTLQSAEKEFQDGNFAAAKTQYEQVLKTSLAENEKLQAQLRLAACQYHLGEFLNAAKTIYSYELPENPVWKARFLLYRTHLAAQVARSYRRILNEYEIDTPEAKADLETWTQKQWEQQQEKDFQALWSWRTDLINAPIEQENLILNLKDTDTRRIPTLFDFTVQTYLDFLSRTDEKKTAPNILQTAYSLEGTNRQNAKLFWQTDFILQSTEQPKPNTKGDISAVVEQLNKLSGFTAKEPGSWWQRLKDRFVTKQQPDTSYARGYTAWKTAELLNSHQQAPQAAQICAYAETLTPSYFTQACQNLVQQISQISLNVQLPTAAVPLQAPKIRFSGKNLHTVYAKLYSTSLNELETFYKKNYSKSAVHNWSQIFRAPSTKDLLGFLKKTPLQTLSQSVVYEELAKPQQGTLSFKALTPGIYVALFAADESFDPKTTPVQALILNATELALFASAGIEGDPAVFTPLLSSTPKTYTPSVFHLYGVNLQTGEPVGNIPVELITNWEGTREKVQLQKDGTATLQRDILVSAGNDQSYTYHQIDALGKLGNSLAYTGNLSFSFDSPDPVLLVAQTDRAIYRPGQKVQIAAQAFERQVRGWKTLGNKTVQVTVLDPNWKTIFTAKLPLNELGTAQTAFTLPEEGLLGDYQLKMDLTPSLRGGTATQSFQVEQFKRPDYEITLNEPEKPLELGKSGEITGNAAYYFGAPLADAKVVYTLKRRAYRPPFYWWWSWWNPPAEETLKQGETKTDDKGNFAVTFTPSLAKAEDEFAQFVLNAQVYDESGRPIETTRSYQVSKHPHLFKVDFAQGFYDAHQPAQLAKIDLTDVGGKSVTGKLHLKAQLLENKFPATDYEQAANEDDYYFLPRSQKPSLEQLYKDVAVQKTAFEKTLSFTTPGVQTVELPSLPEGVYRLEITSEKAAPQQLIFIVAAENSTLQLPEITLAQHTAYYPGETLRVLLGTTALKNSKRVEIYQNNQFIIHKEKLPGGAQIFAFPVTQTMRGGLALRWFGASNYQLYQGQTSVEVPFDNKKLALNLDVPTALKPGEMTNWKLTAKDVSGAPVNGQANVTVYDKSLDYYQQLSPALTFTQLFSQRLGTPANTHSAHGANTHFLGQPELKQKATFAWLPIPSLNLTMNPRSYGRVKGAQGMMMLNAAAPRAAMAKSRALEEDTADYALAESAVSMGAIQDEKAVNTSSTQEDTSFVRTDFAETAYFNTALPLSNGQARLKFKMPQSLTTWNIVGFVLTRAADFGDFTAQTITRKDFMLRLTLPRFYREGDKGILQAAVTNQTNRKLTAQVTLSVTRNQKSALADFGIKTPVQTVTVDPQSTRFTSWEITAPNAPDLYQITAVARSGKESDGEQKDLPVFPAKQRLLAAAHTALKNGANTLSLTELENVPAQDVEMTSLTINPSLALSVLNSMPNLLTNPCKDLVSSLNRYVPLAVVHQFYATYPQLKEAVKKLPKRTGLTASWEENNPLRLELLASTPWLRQAQGRQIHTANIINLFDEKNVAALLEKELKNIAKFQNANGAFTWFAGGPDDEYLTLYALNAFAQALAYQANIPQTQAQKAFKFIVPKIEARLKQDKEGSVAAVSYALYAAYTLSAFPNTWPQYAAAKPYLKRWVDYADEQAKFMTPLGQIYAAAVYHRLGDDVKATQYLDRVLARLKEDPLTGAYFAPEAQSWLWYNDTLATQTVTLRTLLEIRPKAPQIDAMTQWLLFNRQVNDWTDSKAAAEAVFTLLDVMKAKGALSAPAKYSFRWGQTIEDVTFEPFDWTEDLQFTHTGTQISPSDYQVIISKQGKMTDFASLNAIYRASSVSASPKGVLNVSRQYFRRVKDETETKLVSVENLENVQVGDEIEVHLTLTTDSAFEYVEVKDPKPAGFESEDLLSHWDWKPIHFYKEVRDASTNFFVSWLPNGTVTLRYVLRPTVPGKFHAAAAQAQSMYAPEYGAHTASGTITVEK